MKLVPGPIASTMVCLSFGIGNALAQPEASLPIADAHVHYSHDSVEMTPPERVIDIMRDSNLKFALVSSSDDRGTRLLTDLAPDLIVPGLRPYTRRGQLSSWFTSDENLAYVETLLKKNRYASIGEFHLYGDDADLLIPRRIVELAETHNLLLHAHSDAEAVERLLAQSPDVKVLWAHSGFEDPEEIAAMLKKHDRLWADLAFRSDVGRDGELDESWTALFTRYPDRMMLGTDTFTPERIHFIPLHAEQSRQWLASLPDDIAERVAWKNAHDLIMPIWEANREDSCDHGNAEFLLESEGLSVGIRPMTPISVSQAFPVSVTVCGNVAAEATVELDATMPAHGHGMNYKPPHSVVAKNGQRQQVMVEGVVLHMPGDWQWSVDVRTPDSHQVLTQSFTVQ